MEPAFRRSVSGKLSLADTTEAISIRSENRGRDYTKALPAAVVRKRAEAAVRRMNGDLNNKIHLLGQFTIQFGQFRNETFKWLVSNSLGYAAFIVVSSQNDPASADERWVNKMALKNYLSLFPEGLEAINIKKLEKQGRQAPAKPQSKLVEAATDLMSDTDDNELSAMAEKIEFDLQAVDAEA
ncbi:uncharacterized protein LOC123560232 [Mercenaria mercenaria]|uniref:uncharacterized protein LOC123560232 n=1 Tax=Mercenaria mercenaria TaxID=6596 RepID=UPI00234EF53E|nr:uncharacterized protein LOC123560232 [Mercenaria mercenaria]